MAEVSLKELSERATQGTWSLGETKGGYQYIDAPGLPGKPGPDQNTKWSGLGRFVVEMDDGFSCAGEANVALALALVNAYRSGRLHDDAALAEAEARGRRAGIEDTTQKLRAAIAEETRMGTILLAAGEMTAQERRTVSAVAKRIAWGLDRAMDALTPPQPTATATREDGR